MNRDVYEALAGNHVFGGLSMDEIGRYVSRMQVMQLPRGRTIFRPGEPATAFYVIVEGWVRLSRPVSGAPVTLHVFGPGEAFAEALLMPQAVYPASADTLTSARLVRIETDGYRTLIASQPRVALSVISSCFAKLKRLTDQVEEIKGWTVKRRVAAAVLRFAPTGPGPLEFDFPFDRALVADLIGISAGTLSRTFPTLAALGVEVTRDRIVIDDPARLIDYVRDGRVLPGETA